jgi:Patatin-like phospholipase
MSKSERTPDPAQCTSGKGPRQQPLDQPTNSATSGDFKGLITEERKDLEPEGENCGSSTIAKPGPAEEPWVAFTTEDRVGLVLSGGGIRSATFNLGLLQALQQKDVLKQVDYLSTVSGGGYIDGFWNRCWRAIQETNEFSVAELTDLPSLARQLGHPESGVSKFLRRRLSAATRRALVHCRSPDSNAEKLKLALTKSLNRIVCGRSIYRDQGFQKVVLRPPTKNLLEQHRQRKLEGDALKRFNKLRVEDALEMWKTRRAFPKLLAPANPASPRGPKEIREPAQIRHLREFSRFLIPRKGLTAEV